MDNKVIIYFNNLIKNCSVVKLKEYPDTIFYIKNLRGKKLNRILQLNENIKGEVVLELDLRNRYIFIKSKYWEILNSLTESNLRRSDSVSETIRSFPIFENYYITEGMMKYSKINNFF